MESILLYIVYGKIFMRRETMVKKRYTIENLACANCAAKMEEMINQLPGVTATVTFSTKTLVLTAENPEKLLPQLQKIVSSVEPDAKITRHIRAGERKQAPAHNQDDGQPPDATKQLFFGLGLLLFGLLLDGADAAVFGLPVSFFAYLMAYLLLGAQILIAAAKNIKNGRVFDENFLMSIATIGAIIIGEFPEAVGVMLFYRVGEYCQELAVARSRKQILEASELRPDTVTLTDGTVLPVEKVQVGTELIVRPGDRIGVDCVVVSGSSRLNTAAVTGESVPKAVHPGDSVLSGCINLSSQLVLRAEKPLSESMVTRILNAVETAAAGKPKIDSVITRFARIYTPVVVIGAVLLAVIPSLITGQWAKWIYTALSMLVISCPCALVLSVPLAYFCAIGAGSKQGILFKGGLSLEAMATIKAVALDKTGTVTRGEFTVQPCKLEILRLCAACEQYSSHPIAVSILEAAKQKAIEPERPTELEEIPGYGIRATIGMRRVLCGNRKLLEQANVPVPEVQELGSIVYVAVNGVCVGYLVVSDTVKTGANRAVNAVEAMGIPVAMLTGDVKEAAEAAAERANIRQVYARLLPEEKLETLELLRDEIGPVLFVGDGINDAPVLAGADVGAAMGSGADAAIEAADVVFLNNNLSSIPVALKLARATRSVAWQNIIFALVAKVAVMVLSILGITSLWLAVVADTGVALLCVLNAIRLLRVRKMK